MKKTYIRLTKKEKEAIKAEIEKLKTSRILTWDDSPLCTLVYPVFDDRYNVFPNCKKCPFVRYYGFPCDEATDDPIKLARKFKKVLSPNPPPIFKGYIRWTRDIETNTNVFVAETFGNTGKKTIYGDAEIAKRILSQERAQERGADSRASRIKR